MLELKTLADADFIPWLHAEARAYGNRLDHDPAVLRPHFDLTRTIAVYDTPGSAGGTPGSASPGVSGSGIIVGGAHSHRLEMSVPGGAAPVAGVANVAVQPTHRRRGVMSMMMRHQLHDCHARGEPLAALFASESGIYGRFGYGIGSFHEHWRIDRHHTAYARPHDRDRDRDRDRAAAGRISFVDPARILDELPEVFRRATAGRPGVFQRARHHWQQAADDPEHRQGGPGGLFYAAYRNADDGRIEGYAVYRTRRPVVIVQELMTTTVDAAAALWRFCFDTDLMETTEALKRPVDDPLPWLLADPRRLQRTTRDGLWLRIVDAQSALPLRAYAAPGRLTIRIQDDLCPWNNTAITLETAPDDDTNAALTRAANYGAGILTETAPGANAAVDSSAALDAGAAPSAVAYPAQVPPDVTITVSALASAYLGAAAFTTFARAGLAEEHTPGALQKADRMFAVTHQPWTPYNF